MDVDRLTRSVPETVPRTLATPSDSRRGVLRHAVLNYHEIASGRFVNVESECEYLRVLCTFPVVLIADGVPLVPEGETVGIVGGLVGGNTWQPVTTLAPPLLRPVIAFAIRRTISRLTVLCPTVAADYVSGDVVGACHLWLGTADCEHADFGLPVSHMTGNGIVGGASQERAFTMQPALHYGIASPSGALWLPSRTLLTGVHVYQPTWSGGAGVIDRVAVEYSSGFVLAQYWPNVAAWDYDFGTPVEVAPWAMFEPGGNGFLQLRVHATAAFTAVSGDFRCLSYL